MTRPRALRLTIYVDDATKTWPNWTERMWMMLMALDVRVDEIHERTNAVIAECAVGADTPVHAVPGVTSVKVKPVEEPVFDNVTRLFKDKNRQRRSA